MYYSDSYILKMIFIITGQCFYIIFKKILYYISGDPELFYKFFFYMTYLVNWKIYLGFIEIKLK